MTLTRCPVCGILTGRKGKCYGDHAWDAAGYCPCGMPMPCEVHRPWNDRHDRLIQFDGTSDE